MKRQFRAAARKGLRSVVQYLDELRRLDDVDYPSCVSCLKKFAPSEANRLFSGGPKSIAGLASGGLSPISIEKELRWAIAWLVGQEKKINKFRAFSLEIQDRFLEGALEQAVAELDEFINRNGWCLWGIELRCALGQIALGSEVQKKWSAKLQQEAPNTLPTLLLLIYGERNDDSFSYDTFHSKCMASFHRYNSVADWLPRYLLYRSLISYSDPIATFSSALARDMTSSLFDYYETLIDTIKVICNEKSLRKNRESALSLVTELRRNGFVDHRLDKLSVALSGAQESVREHDSNKRVEQISSYLCGHRQQALNGEDLGVLGTHINLIKESRNTGVAAKSAVAALSKFGLNFRSLDIGCAIAMAAHDSTSDLITTRVLSLDCVVLSPKLSLEDIGGFPDDIGRRIVESLADNALSQDTRERCKSIAPILQGERIHLNIGMPDILYLWLARQLIVSERYEEARWLGQKFESLGSQWVRHGAKLSMWAMIKQNKIQEALEFSSKWLVDNPEYVTELPFGEIFDARDWHQFRSLNPIVVGLVAHHVHVSTGSSMVGYICKMACRQFAVRGLIGELQRLHETYSCDEKKCLISFLRDVWVEENLSMNHLLESTDDVRSERIGVLQMLLVWDAGNEQVYVDEIKQLTFEETLSHGLRHINQTRVFVNEVGVTRWAEKELAHDYDRWVNLASSASGLEVAVGLARKYVVDPQSEELLALLSDGKPTEADALLTSIVDRLFTRFLSDSADGLDCYLSLRIRHGSLRGTLFGPLEEQGLFYSVSGFSRNTFEKRWMTLINLDHARSAEIFDLMEKFTASLKAIADELVNERVQVRCVEKPKGSIARYVFPAAGVFFRSTLASQQVSFTSFVYTCYFIFWKYVEVGLQDLVGFMREVVKPRIQSEFDGLTAALRRVSPKTIPLTTALTTVATTTQSQCDSIVEWFRPPGKLDNEKYKLSAAVEIARSSSKNVHRAFAADVRLGDMPREDPPLATLALVVLSDALFVVFENAWKHSGLGTATGEMDLDARFDPRAKLLTLRVRSNLGEEVLSQLEGGLLNQLRDRYIRENSLEFANREGGSGFAKLARLSRYVDRGVCPEPLGFGVIGGRWYTEVTIPLFERDGAYEAFQ